MTHLKHPASSCFTPIKYFSEFRLLVLGKITFTSESLVRHFYNVTNPIIFDICVFIKNCSVYLCSVRKWMKKNNHRLLDCRGNVTFDSVLIPLVMKTDSFDPFMIGSSEPAAAGGGGGSLWLTKQHFVTLIAAFSCLLLASRPSCSASSRELSIANICSKRQL